MLAADTGLGLAPWELKLFLKELDLGDDDRVSADRFCGIHTFLASRPPTPAAVPAAAPVTEPVEAAAAAATAPEPAQTEAAQTEPSEATSAPAVPGDEAAEPLPREARATPTGVPFPPEFALDPVFGVTPAEKASWSLLAKDSPDGSAAIQGSSAEGRWRRADGAGQCAAYPFLGAARSAFARAVRSARAEDASRRLPPPRALAALHCEGAAETASFAAHPNAVSGVFHAFHQLLRHELGIDAAAGDAGAGWWRCDKSAYLDLQTVYGADDAETRRVRIEDAETGVGGSIDVDAVVRRAGLATRLSGDLGGSGSANAAQALLTTFARNHNHLAARVAEKLAEKTEDGSLSVSLADDAFQMARHANCAAFRAVVLKDYLPFVTGSGPSKGEIEKAASPKSPNDVENAREAARGACVSVELDLLMRAIASTAPREETEESEEGSGGPPSVAKALASASSRRCGLGARRSLPARMVPAETAAVRRARAAKACTLNEFRAARGLPRWADFDALTAGEEALSRALSELYGGNVDDVELYTGFLCERNVADEGACLTTTARETAGTMVRALASGDAFFSETFLGETLAEVSDAAGAEFGTDATLAGLLEKHAGVTVTGASAFEVGALAKKKEDGDDPARDV